VRTIFMLQIFLFQLLCLIPWKWRWRSLFEACPLALLRRLLETYRAGPFALLPQSLLISHPLVIFIRLGDLPRRNIFLRQLIERHKHVVCARKLL